MLSVEIFVLLLALVAVIPLLADKINIPYPTLLVVTGLGLCFIPGLPRFHLDPDLVLLFVLPPLIYRAAITTSWRDFKENLRPILLLGVGLVVFTTLAVGIVVKLMLPTLPWAAAFVLGAIVSPSDTVAAIAIMQKLPVPRRVVTILEGESLINDATGLIAYKFATAAVLTGTFSLGHASAGFVWAVVGGVAVGLGVSWVIQNIQQRLDNPPVQSTISLVTPFLAYLPADLMGASGIISVVTVGVFLGWNSIDTITARVRLLVFPMWEMIEFVLNGFIFLAIGLQLPTVWHGLSGTPLPVLAKIAGAVCAAVTGVRILWVFPATYCPRLFSRSLARRDPYPPAKSVVLVAWIGMRGVVSLAAAMALPLDQDNGTPFPGRDLIIFLTFSVILSTLVLQGLSLAPLVRWFKLQREDDGRARELVKAWRRAHESALIRIEELASQKKAPEDALARARQRLEAQIALSEDFETAQAVESGRASAYSFVNRVEREIVQAQRREIVKLRNEGAVSFSVAREILRDLDLAEEKLH